LKRIFALIFVLLLLLCSAVRICFPVQWGSLFLLMTIQSLFMNAVAFFLLAVSGECAIPLFGCVLYQLASWTLRDIFPEHLSIYLLSDALPELSKILLKGMNAIPIAIALAIAGVSLFFFRTMRRE